MFDGARCGKSGLGLPTFKYGDPRLVSRSESYFQTLVTLRASGSPIGIHKFLRSVSSKALADVAVRIDILLPAIMKPDVCLALQAFRATLTTLEMIIYGGFAWEDL